MAHSRRLSLLLFSLCFFIFQFHFLSAQTVIKGGYWFSGSGFPVSNINASLFTHLFCAFANIDPNTYQVTISSSNLPLFSTFTQTVQQNNSSVKTLLSIGGGGSNSTTFSAMAAQPTTRKSFIDSSIQLARSYNFHGLDLDWEYPDTRTDMTNFGLLLNEWRAAVANESNTTGNTTLLLSAAVFRSSDYYTLDYPIQSISNSLDWVNIMAYDFYGPLWFPNLTAPPAPLYNPPDQVSGDAGVSSWIQSGLSANKLALGLPFYGYAWRLLDDNNHGLFAPASGSAIGGDGSMGYRQIRNFISQNGAQTVYNSTVVSDYCYSGTTWIGYDDTQSVFTKVTYAKEKGLFGYFAWHVGADNNWALSQTAFQAWGS